MGDFRRSAEFDCHENDVLYVEEIGFLEIVRVTKTQVAIQFTTHDGRSDIIQIDGGTEMDTDSLESDISLMSKVKATSTHERESPWALDYLLLTDLVELLEERYDEENRRWLLVVLDALLGSLPESGMLRRADLQKMARDVPRLRQFVAKLELEFVELVFQLRKLRNRVAWRISLLEEVSVEVCRGLRSWLIAFADLSEREARWQRTARKYRAPQCARQVHFEAWNCPAWIKDRR